MTHFAKPEQLQTVERLAALGVPMADMATLIGIAEKTLRKRYQKAIEKGRSKAHLEARTALFDEAVRKRNPTMLIFYCKTQLGMSDKAATTEETSQPLHGATREELMAEILRLSVVSTQDPVATLPAIEHEPHKEPA